MIVPGMLVRNKRNMKVALWDDCVLSTQFNIRPYISMRHQTRTGVLTGVALVVGVTKELSSNKTSRAVCLFLPWSQRFAYTWSSSLYIL
jgi:hypothetical protein